MNNKPTNSASLLIATICLIGFVSLVVGAFIFTEAEILAITGR